MQNFKTSREVRWDVDEVSSHTTYCTHKTKHPDECLVLYVLFRAALFRLLESQEFRASLLPLVLPQWPLQAPPLPE